MHGGMPLLDRVFQGLPERTVRHVDLLALIVRNLYTKWRLK
jgi:hypothetical protein